MPNNNVAILSIMSKFDEKSAKEAAQRANKVYDEALSDIGNVNFDKKLLDNFDKAMNLLKNKFKKVNLSSYTNNLLDSIFSDKDISEKSKDIESFIKKIDLLKKASSGQDINAFNTFSAKQIEALISRTEKLAQKQDEINEKTREYNREATKIAKTNRSISTIDKNYGDQDYSKTLESLKKSLGTEKEFTAEQNQSIENLAKLVNLYQTMEKSEPQKGTAEAIRYSKDLLAVTQKIKEERDKIDSFSQKGASTYINNNGLSSIDKVSDYTVNRAKNDFTKANLSNLKAQEAKLQGELTTYISDSVQKNLAKVSKEADAVIDKAEKRVENLQNKIDSLQSKPNNTGTDNSLIGNIVSDSDVKTLEEIENRLMDINELDADGDAKNKDLKEYIQLYKEYLSMVKDPDKYLKQEYNDIIERSDSLKKYADTLDETISKQKELNDAKDNKNDSVNSQTEQLVKQEEQIKETVQAEKQLQDVQEKVSSNTKISVDVEQAIADINKVKENLENIPDEKKIKISINDNNNDYSNTPLLSDAEGNTITAFRGVVGAWSGLINQDGIGFFTDKLKLAADYADSLAESGKVYQANLSFKNPLEVEGNGAKWDEIDFNGVKKTTDEIVELAKRLGHDGVIFKNIRDGFADTEEDISNVMVALNAAQIKNEQVIGTVKAGTGEMVDVANKIDNATNTATNSTVESQNKIQEELKETQKVAEQVSEAMSNTGSDKSNISSGTQIKDVIHGDAEKSGMDNIASVTEEAVQAKKDFATANEGVQSSVDGSKSKLELEAELMKQIAKSAREAADAKKEFVKANAEVKASAEASNNKTKNYKTKENTNAWNELSYSIQRYSEVSKRISSGKAFEGDIEEAERLENKISQLQKLDVLSPTQIEKSEQMLVKLYDKLDDIEKKAKKASLESMQSEIDSYNNKIPEKPVAKNSKFQATIDNYKNAIREAQTYLDNLGNTPITEEQTKQWKILTDNIEEAKKKMEAFSAAEKGSDEASRTKEIDKLTKYLEKNTRISKEARKQLDEYLSILKSGDPSVNVKEIHTAWTEVAVAEREAGREGKSFFNILKNKTVYNYAAQLAGYYLSFMDIIRYARNAVNAVQELDTALVDLKKTTTMSTSELEQFYFDSNNVAKKMGVTTASIIEQASSWSRLGYSTKEASTQMAELSSQFASISPGMSTDDAQEGLVSIMKAWDISTDEVEREVMDNINVLGNKFAETNQDIVEGMKRSAATFAALGQTWTDSFAIFTGAQEVIQNAETVGTALKTLSLRVRGYSEETEELDSELANITGEVIDLTKTTSNPQGISLFTDTSQEHYKSMVDYLGEISDIWNEIDEKSKTDLLEKLFGKRGASVGSAIIGNFDSVRNALTEMEGASGAADAEMGIIQESIDYKINTLKETWVGVAQEMLDRGDIGVLIDALTKLSEVIGMVVDKAGMLGTLGAISGLLMNKAGIGERTMFQW